jgi:putative intracellular protease/amidase
MAKSILLIASNYGLWAEELQAPWDALKDAGHNLTLATYKGVTPLPLDYSIDASFVDPVQRTKVNPPEVVQRVNEILDSGEWDSARKVADVQMADFDAIVMVGGPGAALDISGNAKVHSLILDACRGEKLIGAICYAVGALALARDPDNTNKSVIFGRRVTAHPHAWDIPYDIPYTLARTTPENPGSNIVTPGFVFPLQWIVEDAVGDPSKVVADPTANRENPRVARDGNFVTGLSVESSIAFGRKLVEALAGES